MKKRRKQFQEKKRPSQPIGAWFGIATGAAATMVFTALIQRIVSPLSSVAATWTFFAVGAIVVVLLTAERQWHQWRGLPRASVARRWLAVCAVIGLMALSAWGIASLAPAPNQSGGDIERGLFSGPAGGHPDFVRLWFGTNVYAVPWKALVDRDSTIATFAVGAHASPMIPGSLRMNGDGKLLVSLRLPQGPLTPDVIIERNVLKQVSGDYDWNAHGSDFEVVDERGQPVVQIEVRHGTDVFLSAMWWDGETFTKVGPGVDAAFGPSTTRPSWDLKPLFKYPSSRHKGEYAEGR